MGMAEGGIMLVLKNCNFLGELVEGYENATGDILIDGDRIKSIAPCGTDWEDAETVDMAGKYVLPGLFDLHIHLTLSGGETLVDNAKSPVQQALDAVKFANDTLMAGFTTVRDVGSSHNVAIELRNAINAGNFPGPNIIASGKIVTPTECGNDFFAGLYNEADGRDAIWKSVREEMKAGADFIKIMGTGAVMNPGGAPGQPIYTLDELRAVVEAARFKDTYVATHCHGTQAIKNSIIAGVRTIEHASILDDEAIEMLKDNDTTYIVPTLNILHGLADSVPETSIFMKSKAQKVLESLRVGVRKAYEAGLTIGFGTDQGGTPLTHGENADEFILRKDFWDMDEMDIIKQATIDSARIVYKDQDYGTLKEGKVADIITLDKNPLEDISAFKYNLVNVIKSGVVVK
ncbi:amidohydrolase family protein [Lactonifactor sp. BIOML-A3]|nr:amidohydrolase family protein [Lactonifactor sp. BIOML-A5]MSA06597.1 amidohydrolase family protein [Lactonifactor sp. BIOML-A4]MSA11271.1 amidohydrolase family protein [Lactonifactor sp. BIOML-A3]MSA15829.1 amidohydrolase family protein [Lactonifactor sp. BIOML-A2]MSA36188.1 amidohydrolase family protein [Lactonifactor sp. BIOML-A1]MSB11999.1 amidohydrolase family protein [Lactonifactor sp. BIOML-A6]MSB67877.1 amidohydrolase family protein [Lactonifactor sp. BIOML-A7]